MSNFKPRPDDLLFLPLGGANEIGMNVNLYHYQGKWLLVDCGSGFTDGTIPGVDMMVADMSFIHQHRQDIVGLFITHAHEDHVGGIQYLWNELRCPIYATKFTANFLRHRLKEYTLSGIEIIELAIGNTETDESKKRIDIGPFNIEMISLTHSAPEMQALLIRTAAGKILHTGDWKLDHDPLIGQVSDEALLRKYGSEDGGILALVCDSTNVFSPGRSGSEGDLRHSLVDIIGKSSGLVVVTTFASNLARLDTIIHAAEANGRRVVIAGKSVHRMVTVAQESGYLQDVKEFINERDIQNWNREQLLVIATGCQGESQAATVKMAEDNHRVRLAPGDTVIFSSKIIPGNERKIFNLFNTFTRRNIEVITERDHFVHVSGHPSIEELRTMYDLVRPKIAIPVHGESLHIHEHAKLARSWGIEHVIEVKNGSMVSLNPHQPSIITSVKNGYLAVDGNCLLPIASPIFETRRKLMHSGAIIITLLYNKVQLVAEPVISYPGCLDPRNDFQLMDMVKKEVKIKLRTFNNRSSKEDLVQGLKRHVQHIVRKELGKDPLLIINVETVNK